MKGVGRKEQIEAYYEEHADSLSRFAAALVGSNDAQDVLSVAVLNVLRTGSEIDNMPPICTEASIVRRCITGEQPDDAPDAKAWFGSRRSRETTQSTSALLTLLVR